MGKSSPLPKLHRIPTRQVWRQAPQLKASSSCISTIRSLMDTTALLPALSLLRVLLRVKRLSSSPMADVFCAAYFFGEPSIECASAFSYYEQWGCRDWGLRCNSRRTRLRFAGGVRGAAGSVDSEGVLSPRIQAAISGQWESHGCGKERRGVKGFVYGSSCLRASLPQSGLV